jgi:hypothetical protein
MKRFLILVFVIFYVSSSSGQGRQSVLWKISGNGLTKQSYLFGTYHLYLFKDLLKFREIDSLMRSVDIGLFEINPKQSDGLELAQAGVHEPPLDSIFTPQEYKLVDDFFTNTPLGSIRPHNNDASLTGMIQVAMTYKRNHGNQYFTLDDGIKHFMDSLGKGIDGLDDVNDASKLAFESQYRNNAKTLVAVIKSSDDQVAGELPYDYQKYLMADMQLTTEQNLKLKEFTFRRNEIWVPKIINKLKDKSCFIAVGLAHLQFKTGLINLLRKRGFKLTPVKLKIVKL